MHWLIFLFGLVVGGCFGLVISLLLSADHHEQLWWEGYWKGYQRKWQEDNTHENS